MTAAPQLRYKTHRESSNFHDFAAGYMHADVADLNRDGLPDLLFTTAVKSSEPNQGHALRMRKDRVITLPDGQPMKNVVGQPAQTIPIDWDVDGRIDLIINHGQTMDTAPALVRNIGTKSDPRFDFPQRLQCFGDELSGIAKHGPYYGVGDLDDDGKPDLLACTEMGTYHFFRRTALDMPQRPTFAIGRAAVDSE